MSEFVQCFLILSGFLFAIFCGYVIQMKDKDKEFSATKINVATMKRSSKRNLLLLRVY